MADLTPAIYQIVNYTYDLLLHTTNNANTYLGDVIERVNTHIDQLPSKINSGVKEVIDNAVAGLSSVTGRLEQSVNIIDTKIAKNN